MAIGEFIGHSLYLKELIISCCVEVMEPITKALAGNHSLPLKKLIFEDGFICITDIYCRQIYGKIHCKHHYTRIIMSQ